MYCYICDMNKRHLFSDIDNKEMPPKLSNQQNHVAPKQFVGLRRRSIGTGA